VANGLARIGGSLAESQTILRINARSGTDFYSKKEGRLMGLWLWIYISITTRIASSAVSAGAILATLKMPGFAFVQMVMPLKTVSALSASSMVMPQ